MAEQIVAGERFPPRGGSGVVDERTYRRPLTIGDPTMPRDDSDRVEEVQLLESVIADLCHTLTLISGMTTVALPESQRFQYIASLADGAIAKVKGIR